jgi:hypothetical protein
MTKAFVKQSDKGRLDHIRKIAEKPDINKSFDDLFTGKFFMDEKASLSDLMNDSLFRAATHLTRATAVAYTNFIGTITNIATKQFGITSANLFTGAPIMVPVKGKPSEVYVFLNVTPDTTDLRELQTVSWSANAKVLKTFYLERKAQLDAGGSGAQAWATFKRGLKRIHKYEQMPITRAIARYTGAMKVCKWTETHIRDVCSAYEESVKPIELLWADTDPTMFWEMYKTGPASCMSPQPGAGGVSGVRPWIFLTEKNWHPTSIFAFSPHVKGVFFKSAKGDVAARTMVYEKEGKKEFGRIYGSSDINRNRLANGLKALGYTPLNGVLEFEGLRGQAWHHKYTFEVPAFQGPDAMGNAPVLPVPYMDNHTMELHAEYDEERNVFIIECDGTQKRNLNAQSTQGFVLASTLDENTCHNCGNMLGGDKIVTQDGLGVFCNSHCASGGGYAYAHRDDGTQVWVPAHSIIVDFYNQRRYTNAAAAARHDVLPFRTNLGEDSEEEDEIYTSQLGEPVKHNNEVFRLAHAAFERIPAIKRRTGATVNGRYFTVIETDVDGPTINIKPVKTVVIEDNFTPWTQEEVKRTSGVNI